MREKQPEITRTSTAGGRELRLAARPPASLISLRSPKTTRNHPLEFQLPLNFFRIPACIISPFSSNDVIGYLPSVPQEWPLCQVTAGLSWTFQEALSCACPTPNTGLLRLGGTAIYGLDYVFDPESTIQLVNGIATGGFDINERVINGIIDTANNGFEDRANATVVVESWCAGGSSGCGPILDIVKPNIPFIRNAKVNGSNFQFTLLTDTFDSNCTVFASTNLMTWINLGPVPVINGMGTFIDSDYPNNPNRFYTALRGDVSGDPIVSSVVSTGSGGSDGADGSGGGVGSGGPPSPDMASVFGSASLPQDQTSLPPPPPGTMYGPDGTLQPLPP